MNDKGPSATDILVVGIGAVGEWATEFLARTPDVKSLGIADVDRRRGEAIALRTSVGALHQGYSPRLSFHQLDLTNVDETASLIEQLRPKVILHLAALLSVPTMAQSLPSHIFKGLRTVGFGAFLPLHLFLTLKLMQAVKQVSEPPDVIDAPFPDFVNPVLATAGLAPLAGCGNVNLIAGLTRLLVAHDRGVNANDVHLYFISSHSVNESFLRDGNPGTAPYYFRAYISGVDVTNELDVEKILGEASARLGGVPTVAHTAASAVQVVMSLLRGDRMHLHAPGPNGLPGGYPVRLHSGHAEVLLPPELPLEEAIRINQAGLQVGGIEKITSDGTVYHTQAAAEFMQQHFGYDVPSFHLQETESLAYELLRRFKQAFATEGKEAGR